MVRPVLMMMETENRGPIRPGEAAVNQVRRPVRAVTMG